ncbi:hypothetical protein HBH56_069970 [Parastagonospora nodorum]|uniref:Uncharacterized protein n=2 Tax=Phaeosphaeria nodorum (strain SN15 / ATCC MYA-4574 / FGSC 10173) TaxID=321614 RepID=A0A7U2HVQ3_PHANO|nr:hypothetical protein HBH56_069970 [Parastagonospora nodorum]QRC93630.1 hypothetical protein JI435_038290 [Parastagonospora nodorum SN15]KAH3932469.1 hypothetical protein HBH54_078150 [Parastagonospora nodorum]KAH3955157.1 hypothetical protein HBH53_016220 [Parastagonospora nodorum]KAH3986539.1 hypothetical protein HBH52_047370 [Parastagonospora nodorum]
MAPPRAPVGAVEIFKKYHGRLLQLEQERLDPESAPETPLNITADMWPFIPRKVMESIPISSAPTFRPDEALPEAPDAVSAVKKQEADYILRVFYILWSAFLDFRETTWTTPIAGVPNHDTLEPVIIVDELKTDRWNGYWSKFPTDRIPPLQDTTTRVQVLCTGSCLDTAHFTRLIEQVFEGMSVTLEEISFRLDPSHPTTSLLTGQTHTQPCTHPLWCLRVTSTLTHRQWAIHLSGPQYAKLEPATDWLDFARSYIAPDSEFLVLPFGSLARYTAAVSKTKGVDGMRCDLSAGGMQAFHDTVDKAMGRKNLSWTKVMRKSDEDFMRHADKILRVGNRAVEAWMEGVGQLGKRRRDAERWERRHGEEMEREQERVWGEVKREGKGERFDGKKALEGVGKEKLIEVAMEMWREKDEEMAKAKGDEDEGSIDGDVEESVERSERKSEASKKEVEKAEGKE